LPVSYFHIVFTLPHELSALALQNKRLLYDLLFRASAATLLELAGDPKHLGADIGFLGVLHTWGQNMSPSTTAKLFRSMGCHQTVVFVGGEERNPHVGRCRCDRKCRGRHYQREQRENRGKLRTEPPMTNPADETAMPLQGTSTNGGTTPAGKGISA
jgi:hypothetical protein